jgi:magnesium-protoporphyrin O-methyltransferase
MQQLQSSEIIKSYFEGAGFDRLRMAYADKVDEGYKSSIRDGHREVVETVVDWLGQTLDQCSLLDAGCGTGAIAVPLALAGARVDAIDLSSRMIAEGEARAREANVPTGRLKFAVGDLAAVEQTYDAVVCIDVFARYSTEASIGILKQLATLAKSRLIFTYTPKQLLDPVLLAIGGFVAKRRQAPPLYTHSKKAIAGSLASLGWKIHRQKLVTAGWKSYFCCLVEARREDAARV